ncbi:MAG: pitrilysin family protein [Pseudomonadota bacterium]
MIRAFILLLLSIVLFACGGEVKDAPLPKETEAAGGQLPLPSGVSLLEHGPSTAMNTDVGAIGIPYEKFRLDNGLTVVLHEDHSDPLIHVDVTYHVGSSREERGRSGFAHFFEHMMFQGSQNVEDEQHFKLITEGGGTLNGTTNADRTNYFQTAPNNQLERILWLEADRMGFLLPAVTQEKFEVQRATVKNERAQRVDNQPYGLLSERVGEALYPEGHPYSWQTIGYVEDLDRVNVQDLKAFFLRWYGPNNAVLTIGGDFDRTQTLQWITKYFGPIPRGPEVEKPRRPNIGLDADRFISMEDNVALPLIYRAIPTVHVMHPDEAPLDVLMSIMGSGKTSLLYKNLVKEGLAVEASAGHGCQELSCSFTIYALPNPSKGASLTDLNQIIIDTLAEFETRGVEDDDLARVKAGIVSSKIFGLESVSGKVSQLAYYETFFDNPGMIAVDVERYQSVTKEDVMRAYRTYIKDKPAVVMSVLPKNSNLPPAAQDNWDKPKRVFAEDDTDDKKASLDLRTPEDVFDRSIIPSQGPAPVTQTPAIWRATLPNDSAVIGAINDEVPTTTIVLRFEVGQRDETLDKLGIAALTSSMLNESTEETSGEELSNRLQKLGSSVSIQSGDDYTSLSIRSLTANLDETINIAAEKLFKPKFDAADFDRVKAQTKESIEQSKKNASTLAASARRILLYGKDNAFAYDNRGLLDTLRNLSLDDVREFYENSLQPARSEFVVVSDLPKEDITKRLRKLTEWTTENNPRQIIREFPALSGGTIYLINKDDAPQSEIRIVKRSLTYDATGPFFRSTIMNFPLGGNFNSRINVNLREDKGYAYGARSRFGATEYAGSFVASAAVRGDATRASVEEFFKEISAYAEKGINNDELAFTKNALLQRKALDYETPLAKAGYLSTVLAYDLDPNYGAEQDEILMQLDVETINALARESLKLDDMATIIVGDIAAIEEELAKLNLPLVKIDEFAEPIE